VIDLSTLSREQKIEFIHLLEEKERRKKGRFIDTLYPAEGDFRRELYPKHMEFFAAGAEYRERLFVAANRVGKTLAGGGYETALHLTGDYPDWWIGRRFDKPINCWVAGDTSKTTRDILQLKLFGETSDIGTGLLPRSNILKTFAKTGVADAIELAHIRHKTGGKSIVALKSYDQRREGFQGTEQDVIWLDEEPPEDVYVECLLRTMTNNGIVMVTATPLMGITPFMISFMPQYGMNA